MILLLISTSIILYLLIVTVVDVSLMGWLTPKYSNELKIASYIIPDTVRIDNQTEFRCSAFSSAFVCRQFGEEANGDSIYSVIPDKMEDGYVYPKGIAKYLKSKGYKVEYCTGNLNSLKNAVAEKNGVIVMIIVRPDRDWLHYVPVVGYTPDSVFIAESLPELQNTTDLRYNRKIGTEEFLKLWNTSAFKMPFYRNTYFVISKE